MNKIIGIFAFCAAVVAFAACVEKSEPLAVPQAKVILKATREGLLTRSLRQGDGSVWWNPSEEVSVFSGSGAYGGIKYVSNNTAAAETVELEGPAPESGSVSDGWAVYPYSTENSCDGSSVTTVIPAVQTGVEDNFSGDVFPAVGKIESGSVSMLNVCGGIKFSVSRSDIKSLTIKGNGGEALAGKVRVVLGAGSIPAVSEVIDSQTEVTIVAPSGGFFSPDVYYYVTLLPASLPDGLTITFDTADGTASFTSDKAQTIKRSIFGVLTGVDSYMEEGSEPDWQNTPFRHQSLLMRFTATWCGWCPRMNKSVATAQENYPGKIQHLAIHGSGSSLYFSSSTPLLNQYKVSGFPTGICDGRIEISNQSITVTARNIVNAAKETESTYGTVSGAKIATTLNGNNLDVNMRLYLKAAGDYLVSVFIVEDGIIAEQSDYEEGDHESYVHDNVARKVLTAARGTAFTQTEDFSTKDFNWSVTLNSNWNASNLRILAYVQAPYGDRTKISSANYGDYYIDNCFTVKAGETLNLEVEE